MKLERVDWWSGLTGDAPHVRDRATVRGVGRGFAWAMVPCVAAGLYGVGRQELLTLDGSGDGEGLARVADCMARGLAQLWPVFLASFLAGAFWLGLFARLRRRPVSSGLLATTLIVTLALPPGVPLWQVAVAMSFGIVLAQEVFGGTGMNVVHPALVALAYMTLAYPASLRDTALGAPVSVGGIAWLLTCAAGGLFLTARRLIAGRVLAGGLVGLAVSAAAFGVIDATAPVASLPPDALAAFGAFAFGLVFVATDPATSAATSRGRWVYGALIGLLTIVLRVMTPAEAEAVFPAILLANLAAPLIDHGVVFANARRRRRRCRHA